MYEPDIEAAQAPFLAGLAKGGLRALIAAPLVIENEVFGVMLVGKRASDSFSSDDCEFLRQLASHVALAAHQARLYGALQVAYQDLRQTQQTVMQQERLRALGQIASGIAHDINNAISPATLYVDSILARASSLDEKTRGQLETVQRASCPEGLEQLPTFVPAVTSRSAPPVKASKPVPAGRVMLT